MRRAVVFDDLLHGSAYIPHKGSGFTGVAAGTVIHPCRVSIMTSRIAARICRDLWGRDDDGRARRVVHPGAAELLDVHAQLDLADPDFFQHDCLTNVAVGVQGACAFDNGP
jgi:hypothetical protein